MLYLFNYFHCRHREYDSPELQKKQNYCPYDISFALSLLDRLYFPAYYIKLQKQLWAPNLSLAVLNRMKIFLMESEKGVDRKEQKHSK